MRIFLDRGQEGGDICAQVHLKSSKSEFQWIPLNVSDWGSQSKASNDSERTFWTKEEISRALFLWEGSLHKRPWGWGGSSDADSLLCQVVLAKAFLPECPLMLHTDAAHLSSSATHSFLKGFLQGVLKYPSHRFGIGTMQKKTHICCLVLIFYYVFRTIHHSRHSVSERIAAVLANSDDWRILWSGVLSRVGGQYCKEQQFISAFSIIKTSIAQFAKTVSYIMLNKRRKIQFYSSFHLKENVAFTTDF